MRTHCHMHSRLHHFQTSALPAVAAGAGRYPGLPPAPYPTVYGVAHGMTHCGRGISPACLPFACARRFFMTAHNR